MELYLLNIPKLKAIFKPKKGACFIYVEFKI